MDRKVWAVGLLVLTTLVAGCVRAGFTPNPTVTDIRQDYVKIRDNCIIGFGVDVDKELARRQEAADKRAIRACAEQGRVPKFQDAFLLKRADACHWEAVYSCALGDQ